MTMAYNKDTDYSKLIKESVEGGNYSKAAEYEKARNEKIDGEKLSYEKTNDYSGWLDKTDYGTVIQKKIASGASRSSVADTLRTRIKKASGTKGLTQYAHDSIYDSAVKYIMNGNRFEFSDRTPKYSDRYASSLESVADGLRRIAPFEYDPYSDDLYEYYRKEYLKAGRRAMEDTLGKIAANTGGVASSYAASAAGQSFDYYNSQAAAKIPELYKIAYGEYLDSINNKYKTAELFSELSNEDYSRYRDRVQDYENNRDFEYKTFLSMLDEDYRREQAERAVYEDERDYSRRVLENDREYDRGVLESDRDYELSKDMFEENKKENSRKWEQQDYENNLKEEQNKISNAIKTWNALGYLDPASAAILGLQAGLPTSNYTYKKAQTAKLNAQTAKTKKKKK